ncbi:TrmH family RNA methyltransferase [Desmospora profundinema]|uniref:TrmH family RNA methyltransferase n=1 Tax=Desmospora profundinema TaxID=1571184 RepID=A0ABU1IRG7_9BACL|nr:RNA methyltransferase [Desmospora profundinema]MDR6226529.1 TrmH family RNA methyltransferase [Desmospora profundinema]
MEIRSITSARNEKVKRWRKLGTRKGREEYRSMLVEGEKLLREAMDANLDIRAILISEEGTGVLERFPELGEVPVYCLYPSIFTGLVDTQSPQGIAAEVSIPRHHTPYIPAHRAQVLLLDAIQDPGNLGAILRTAEAAGIRNIWLGTGTVDPYNPKVVRSAMGSLFRARLHQGDLLKVIAELKALGFQVVGTDPRAEQVHFDVPVPERAALLLGNEGRGVSPELQAMTDERLRIPMPGEVESLNVSVTAGILLYEWVRQVRKTEV